MIEIEKIKDNVWEYLIEEREYEMTKAELDELGKQGWELVTIISREHYSGHEANHIFKKMVHK